MGQGYMPGMAGRGFGSGFGSAPATNSLNQGTNNIGQVYQDMGQNYQRFGQAYQQATQAANQLRSASTTQQQQMNQYLQALQTALGGLSTAGQNTTNQQPMGQPGFSNGGMSTAVDTVMINGQPLDVRSRFNAGQTLGAIGGQGLGSTGEQALNAGQQALINAQTQAFTGTIAPAYQQAVAAGRGLYGSPSMTPQDAYNYIMSPGQFARDPVMSEQADNILKSAPPGSYSETWGKLLSLPDMNPQATDNYIMSPETPEFYNRYASALIGFPASAYTPGFQG